MKIFLEGEQSQMHQRVSALKPGVNEVPDDLGKALVEGCAAYCEQIRKADPRAQPVQLFRYLSEFEMEEKLPAPRKPRQPGRASVNVEPEEPVGLKNSQDAKPEKK